MAETHLVSRDSLRPASILLYRGKGLLGKLIRFFDGSDVNHAGLYLGGQEVGEALAAGVIRQPLGASIGDHSLVLVRCLVAEPSTIQPVLDCGQSYLAQHERYAYEQLLLLAFLSLSRRLKVTPILNRLLRKILDGAASLLAALTAAGREPMICSEFVYRCYDEALPEPDDAYSLRVGEMALEAPMEGTAIPFGLGLHIRTSPLKGRGVHPHSLLAWTVADRRWSPQSFTPAQAEPTDKPEIEALAQTYLEEVQELAPSPSFGPSGDTGLSASVERFALAYYAATNGAAKGSVSFTSSDPFRHLFRTASDFVTPGDLLRTASPVTLGEVR